MSKVSAIASDSGYNPRASEETAALFAFALSLDSGASLYLLRSSRSTVPLPGGKYTLIDAGGGQDFPVQKLAAALDGILPKEDSLWLFSSGGTGRDLALFFAARRGIAAAVNAVGLEASEGGYLVKRMAYGGCLTAGLSIPACAAAAFSKGALPSVRPSGPDEPAETLAIDPGGSPAEVRFEAKENPLPRRVR
jgi:electron transfer flavoprotein alpha subunit